jgi:predicted dehydrogenase
MKACITGLGRIAWAFDKYSTEPFARTHFKALQSLKNIQIIGVDPQPEARKSFADATGCEVYSTLDELSLSHPQLDIMSICSPSEFHFQHFKSSVQFHPKSIWLEKPAAMKISEIEQMIKIQQKEEFKVLVNYPRRFSPPYLRLKQIIDKNIYGKLIEVHLTYSKDLRVNGCHLLDLLTWYLSGQSLDLTYSDCDQKNPSAFFQAGNIKVFVHGQNVDYHNIDIVLTFTEGRASVLQGGKTLIEEQKIENPEFPGFFRLERIKQDDLSFTGNNFQDVLNGLLNPIPSGSTLQDALIIEQMMNDMEQFKAL